MIRVLLAEDMRILRDTLVSVLNLEDDIKVVAQVAVGTDIVPAALVERPDLAVLDIDLPTGSPRRRNCMSGCPRAGWLICGWAPARGP